MQYETQQKELWRIREQLSDTQKLNKTLEEVIYIKNQFDYQFD